MRLLLRVAVAVAVATAVGGDASADPLKLTAGSWEVAETIVSDTCEGKGGTPGNILRYTWTMSWMDGKYHVQVSGPKNTLFTNFVFPPPAAPTPDATRLEFSARTYLDRKVPYGTTGGATPTDIQRVLTSHWDLKLADRRLEGERLYSYVIDEATTSATGASVTQLLACVSRRRVVATAVGGASDAISY